MKPRVRERGHRLAQDLYRGRVVAKFTTCVMGRRTPFGDSAVVGQFLVYLGAAANRWRCLVPIYCFMPDHLHSVFQGQDDSADAWRAMVEFKQRSGFWLGRDRRRDAWQKDFYDHLIRADVDLRAQVRYVADNPVRRGLVHAWSDYPFTGAIGMDLDQVPADASER